MTKDEIMELAAQAGIKDSLEYDHMECDAISLGRFYRLAYVRGMLKQEEQYMQLFLDPENQPTQFGTATQEYREKEIQDEREACALICENFADVDSYPDGIIQDYHAHLIRLRGKA